MPRLLAIDNQVQIVDKHLNENGYLVVKCRFARTGIQERYGSEISPDFEATKIYKEYRSPDEVFKDEVLQAFQRVVITNDHPNQALTSTNTKFHATGFVSSVVSIFENKYLECELTIYCKSVIDDIQNGKVELSAGYLYSITMVEDEEYDYIQTDIIPNHIAIVEAGRCGEHCSLAFDTNSKPKQGKDMKVAFTRMKPDGSVETINEIDISNEDEAKALQLIADSLFNRSKTMVEASKSLDEEIGTLKKEGEDKDEEIVEKQKANDKLQAKLDIQTPTQANDAQIQTLAFDFAGVIAIAQDCHIDVKTQNIESLKKEVIEKVNPALDLKGKSPEYIGYAFDAVKAQIKAADSSFLKALDTTPKSKERETKIATDSADAQTECNKTYGGEK